MFLKRMNSAAPLQSCPGGDASGCDGTTGLQSGSTNSSSSQWNLQALNMADALSRFNLFRPHMLSKCFFKQTNCSPWGEERSEIHVWLYEAVYYLFKPSGSHAHVSESEQLTLNLSVKEPLRRQDAPADCTLNARHSLVPSSCVAGGSLSILNSSLDSSSEPSFPTNAQISVRLDKETMLTFLYWCKQFKKAAFLTAVPSPSFTSWMMSSGREKLFSLFGNGRISDSCCVTEKWQSQWWWPRSARHVTNTQHVCVRPHQRLHVVHRSQVVPDDGGGDLPSNVLTELVSDADHVEVTVHACRQGHTACTASWSLFFPRKHINASARRLFCLPVVWATYRPAKPDQYIYWTITFHISCIL